MYNYYDNSEYIYNYYHINHLRLWFLQDVSRIGRKQYEKMDY